MKSDRFGIFPKLNAMKTPSIGQVYRFACRKIPGSPQHPERNSVAALRKERIKELVAFVRENSPYFERLYRDLPATVDDVGLLPVTEKVSLMAAFDEWPTDRSIKWRDVEKFVANPELAGARFLDRYLVVASSGSTGTPACSLLDDDELRTIVKIASRGGIWRHARKILQAGTGFRLFGSRMRFASIAITEGHYLINVLWRRRGGNRGRHVLYSAFAPIHETVAALNSYRPAFIFGYSGAMAILAEEQSAGRLRIAPALVSVTGERIADAQYGRIAEVFGAPVVDQYACTEALALSDCCVDGWHHLHDDWVVLEPVDSQYRPVPPGKLSHTVLLTVLYRKVQPILRYDLGDAVIQQPTPCPCGDARPAFQVHGRKANLLYSPSGEPVVVAQHLLLNLQSRVPTVLKAQFKEIGVNALELRLSATANADVDHMRMQVNEVLPTLFESADLGHYVVSVVDSAPEISAGGKWSYYIGMG